MYTCHLESGGASCIIAESSHWWGQQAAEQGGFLPLLCCLPTSRVALQVQKWHRQHIPEPVHAATSKKTKAKTSKTLKKTKFWCWRPHPEGSCVHQPHAHKHHSCNKWCLRQATSPESSPRASSATSTEQPKPTHSRMLHFTWLPAASQTRQQNHHAQASPSHCRLPAQGEARESTENPNGKKKID